MGKKLLSGLGLQTQAKMGWGKNYCRVWVSKHKPKWDWETKPLEFFFTNHLGLLYTKFQKIILQIKNTTK